MNLSTAVMFFMPLVEDILNIFRYFYCAMLKGVGLLVGLSCLLRAVNSKVISTKSGDISGRTMKVVGREIDVYLGIPFAQPPVGNLRFKPPLPVKPWNGTYDATKNPPSCMQPFCSGNCSEDCLYLNIWVPSNASKPTSVMVWYYGGAFTIGSINQELNNGSIIAALGDVIFVAINYRLGLFGFFCSETDDARGNMGMKDQLLGLRWVKDNVEYLGGDPSTITIFGVSAGSFSVSMHLVSPLAKGLFKTAIMQSGAAFVSYLIFRNSSIIKERSAMVAELVLCANYGEDISANPNVMECMRRRSALSLIAADTLIFLKLLYGPQNPWNAIFTPLYGDDYMPNPPINEMARGNIHAENLLIGYTKDEGSYFMATFTADPILLLNDPIIIKPMAEGYVDKMFRGSPDVPATKVKDFYLGDAGFFDPSLLKKSYDSMGDALFRCPAVFLANSSSTHGKNVHVYNFTHRWSRSPNPKWMGVAHSEDMNFVFGVPFTNESSFSQEEKEFSGQVINYWTSFAKNGSPNSDVWPPYTNDTPVAMELSTNSKKTGEPYDEKCMFWSNFNK